MISGGFFSVCEVLLGPVYYLFHIIRKCNFHYLSLSQERFSYKYRIYFGEKVQILNICHSFVVQ